MSVSSMPTTFYGMSSNLNRLMVLSTPQALSFNMARFVQQGPMSDPPAPAASTTARGMECVFYNGHPGCGTRWLKTCLGGLAHHAIITCGREERSFRMNGTVYCGSWSVML